jgi:hypothetical protein
MDAPMLPEHSRHGATYRSACLFVGALCLIAALAGTAHRSGPTVHHRTHALAAATLGYDVQGGNHRSGLDAVPAARVAAQLSSARAAAVADAVHQLRRQAPDSVRMRGPPAPA